MRYSGYKPSNWPHLKARHSVCSACSGPHAGGTQQRRGGDLMGALELQHDPAGAGLSVAADCGCRDRRALPEGSWFRVLYCWWGSQRGRVGGGV